MLTYCLTTNYTLLYRAVLAALYGTANDGTTNDGAANDGAANDGATDGITLTLGHLGSS